MGLNEYPDNEDQYLADPAELIRMVVQREYSKPIEPEAFSQGQELALFSHDGKPICQLRLNEEGNHSDDLRRDITYTRIAPSGSLLLVPPAYGQPPESYLIGEVQMDISWKGQLRFMNLNGAGLMNFRFQEPLLQPKPDFEQVPRGQDGQLEGVIQGCEFYAVTRREVYRSKYKKVNEDSIGYNAETGTFAVFDGIGGMGQGQHASALGLATLLGHKGPLQEGVLASSNTVRDFGRALLRPCNAVLAAGRLTGNKLELVSNGDCRWFVIRDGYILENEVRTVLEDEIRAGVMTRRFAHEQLDLDLFEEKAVTITTSLLQCTASGKDLENDTIELEDCDLVVLCSDGADIFARDPRLMQKIAGASPKEAVRAVEEAAKRCNSMGEYIIRLEDGGDPVGAPAPMDNFSMFVLRYKKS